MKWLITGATGQLGPYIVKRLLEAGIVPVLWARQAHEPLFRVPVRPVDLADVSSVNDAIREASPDVILHCAAISSIQDCMKNPRQAEAINVTATKAIAECCADSDAKLIYCSTDLVFDGEKGEKGGYVEQDEVAPLSVYGQSKLAGEGFVLKRPHNVVTRFPMLFGPTLLGRPRFTDQMIRSLKIGEPVTLFDDEFRTAVATDIAAASLIQAGQSNASGLFHVGGQDCLSRQEMGIIVAEQLGLDASLIVARSRHSIAAGEPRPADTSLCSDRWYASFADFPKERFSESINRQWGDVT